MRNKKARTELMPVKGRKIQLLKSNTTGKESNNLLICTTLKQVKKITGKPDSNSECKWIFCADGFGFAGRYGIAQFI